MQPEMAKFLLQSLAIASDLRDIVSDILLILKRLRQNSESGRVDVVRRGNAANHRHLPRVSSKHANSQTGEAVGLGKSSCDKKILDLGSPVDESFSVKFEIRLIDEHSSARRGVRNLNQDVSCDRRASRIVRIRHRDEPCSGANLSKQFARWKCEVVTRPHLYNARAFGLREDRIHGKGGHNDQRFVPRIKIREAQQMNRFVDSVRKQNLGRIESEKTRNLFFNRLAFGITRQQFGIERPQPGQHAWRAPHCALVEIQTQPGSASQRRTVSVEISYRLASFKHGSTSRGTPPRVPASLQPSPA